MICVLPGTIEMVFNLPVLRYFMILAAWCALIVVGATVCGIDSECYGGVCNVQIGECTYVFILKGKE